MDRYLDVPLDLSKVLFICTANYKDGIPTPLADRMDFLNLSGYVAQEKMRIAKDFIEPIVRQRTGVMDRKDVVLEEPAITKLVRYYCREAGVRSLQQHMEKIFRKVAFTLVSEGEKPITIDEHNLEKFVGLPLYSSDRMYDRTPVGVAMGMAYSGLGGSALYIESTADRFVTSLPKGNPPPFLCFVFSADKRVVGWYVFVLYCRLFACGSGGDCG
jgi:ATP-dependent Lon protease